MYRTWERDKVIRSIICFLLISLNVAYAFENHEGEFPDTLESATQISHEFHVSDVDDPCGNHSQFPLDEHACHLGHCSFYLSAFQFTMRTVVVSPFFTHYDDVSAPFIDEEVRPPIFS